MSSSSGSLVCAQDRDSYKGKGWNRGEPWCSACRVDGGHQVRVELGRRPMNTCTNYSCAIRRSTPYTVTVGTLTVGMILRAWPKPEFARTHLDRRAPNLRTYAFSRVAGTCRERRGGSGLASNWGSPCVPDRGFTNPGRRFLLWIQHRETSCKQNQD